MYDTRFSYPKVATMYRKRVLNPKVMRVVTLGTLRCDLIISYHVANTVLSIALQSSQVKLSLPPQIPLMNCPF